MHVVKGDECFRFPLLSIYFNFIISLVKSLSSLSLSLSLLPFLSHVCLSISMCVFVYAFVCAFVRVLNFLRAKCNSQVQFGLHKYFGVGKCDEQDSRVFLL